MFLYLSFYHGHFVIVSNQDLFNEKTDDWNISETLGTFPALLRQRITLQPIFC